MGVEQQVTIYSDGACRGNPGVGGYGTIIVDGTGAEVEISGAEAHTTNNRMELTAAISGLETLTEPTSKIVMVTDSQYLQKGMTEWIKGWIRRDWKTSGRKPVLNRDLWEKLLALTKGRTVEWKWVKGHAGHEQNERCDQLANLAMDEHQFRVS